MLRALALVMGTLIAASAPAQSPPANQSPAAQQAQIRASSAYRELTEAQYQLKLAEQDFVNTQDAHSAAAKTADDIKRELDRMKMVLEAAKLREARARKDYEAALEAVDRAWGKPAQSR